MGSPEMDLYYHNMTGYSAVTKGGIELAETINFYRASPYHKAVGEQLSLEGSTCLLYTSPSPRDRSLSRMPSSA